MTDIQIAQQAAPLPIGDIAAACGIDPQYLEQYGRYKANPFSTCAVCEVR